MLPGIMIAVAFATNPAATSTRPVSEQDAKLAAAELTLRDRIADCVARIESLEDQKKKYEKYLNSIGGGTDEERKRIARLVRMREECAATLEEYRKQKEVIQHLRELERTPRAEPSKAGGK